MMTRGLLRSLATLGTVLLFVGLLRFITALRTIIDVVPMRFNISHDAVHPYILKLLFVISPGALIGNIPIAHLMLAAYLRVGSMSEWNQWSTSTLHRVERWSIGLL